MLLKRKKTKVISNPVANDSGFSSQGSSQPSTQPTLKKAFRNPHPAFRRPIPDHQPAVVRPDPSPRRRSPVKSTPPPRSKPVPRALVSPGKASSALTAAGRGATKRVAAKRLWQGGDTAVRLRDFQEADERPQSSQQSARLVTLRDFGDGSSESEERRSKRGEERKTDNGSGFDDCLNVADAITAAANDILDLDNNADISRFCETLENDGICALVGDDESPIAPPKTKRRQRLLCLESDSEDSDTEIDETPPPGKKIKKTTKKTRTTEKKERSSKQRVKKVTKKTAVKKVKKERKNFQFRFYSTWVECVRCLKWRLLRDIYDPSTLARRWTCAMQEGEAGRAGCSAPQIEWADDVDQHTVYSDFAEGSLVWARVPGFPWWPAMVDRDPDNADVYMWLRETEDCWNDDEDEPPEVGWYHVTFLDKDVSRSWVTTRNIKVFSGVVDMEGLKMGNLSTEYERLIQVACRIAEDAIPLDLTERIKKFGFAFRWKGVNNRWTKYQRRATTKSKKKKPKRRSLDQEILDAAANAEALTEQADAIINELQQDIRSGVLKKRR